MILGDRLGCFVCGICEQKSGSRSIFHILNLGKIRLLYDVYEITSDAKLIADNFC